jgi:hypothetical protein
MYKLNAAGNVMVIGMDIIGRNLMYFLKSAVYSAISFGCILKIVIMLQQFIIAVITGKNIVGSEIQRFYI